MPGLASFCVQVTENLKMLLLMDLGRSELSEMKALKGAPS